MTLSRFLLEGTQGAAITTANSGASLVSFGAGTGTYDSAMKQNGSTGAKFVSAATAQCLARFLASATNTQMAVTFVATLPTAIDSGGPISFAGIRHTSGYAVQLKVTTSGNIQVVDAGGTSTNLITAGTSGFTLGSRYRFALILTTGSTISNGVINAKIYAPTGTTPLSTALNITNANLSLNALAGGDFGIISNTGAAGITVGVDDIQFNDGSFSEIPAYDPTANEAPVVTVGATQTPASGATVTLTSTATDSDGTIASRVWTFDFPTSGAPTLTNATSASASFTAGAVGSLYILRHTATDNLGATGFATMEVRVLDSGTIIPVPTAATGSWTRTGGTTDGGVLGDSSDTTFLTSPTVTATETASRIRFKPSITRSSGTVTIRLDKTDTGSATVTARLYQNNTLLESWSVPVTTTVTDQPHNLLSGTISAITDWGALYIELGATT